MSVHCHRQSRIGSGQFLTTGRGRGPGQGAVVGEGGARALILVVNGTHAGKFPRFPQTNPFKTQLQLKDISHLVTS